MADVSNRTLVGLLVVAIVVSLAGTFVSLNRLGTLGGLSGAATNDTGTVTLEVLGNAELTLQVNAISFGVGNVNGTAPGNQFCDLTSTVAAAMGGNTFGAVAGVLGSDCVSFATPNQTFVVENTGNQEFSTVTVNSTNAQTFAPILGGDLSVNGTYAYQAHEESLAAPGACDPGASLAFAQFVDFTTAPVTVCNNFSASPAQGNAFALQINISIPESANATGGNATDTISFIGNV